MNRRQRFGRCVRKVPLYYTVPLLISPTRKNLPGLLAGRGMQGPRAADGRWGQLKPLDTIAQSLGVGLFMMRSGLVGSGLGALLRHRSLFGVKHLAIGCVYLYFIKGLALLYQHRVLPVAILELILGGNNLSRDFSDSGLGCLARRDARRGLCRLGVRGDRTGNCPGDDNNSHCKA